MLGYKKGNKKLLTGQIPLHYPGDRVYLDGDPTKSVQDKVARKADLTNLDLTGTTNTTGSTIATGTYFYLNGVLVRAKTAIASGATFTENTNYEVVTVGGLNKLNNDLADRGFKYYASPTALYHVVSNAKDTIPFVFTATNIGDFASLGMVIGITTYISSQSSSPRTVLFSFATGKIYLVVTNMSTAETIIIATIG